MIGSVFVSPDAEPASEIESQMRWVVRAEQQRDHAAVRGINLAAFDTAAEANLVDALRAQADPIVSLVAEDDGTIVGHILFSPVTLSAHPGLNVMGLAPMAVAPTHQRRGIGSALVERGVEHCEQLGAVSVVVLGHPDYYPRFGFVPSTRFGIRSEYQVAEEVFMVLELQPGALSGKTGVAKYHALFAGL